MVGLACGEKSINPEATNVFGSDTFPGLINQALAEQVQRVGAGGRKQIPQRLLWKLADRHVVGEFGVARPFCFCRGPERAEDGLELVHVAFPGKVWGAKHELSEDAADGPDVDRGGIVSAAEQELWGAVPSGMLVRRHGTVRD